MTQECEWELLAEVGVDSGQLLLVDPCYIDGESWDAVQWQDIRQYRNKTTGEILEYQKDFHLYDAVIERHGMTMNQLNESGEWEKVEQPAPDGLNYAACCHATLSNEQGGPVNGMGAGIFYRVW